MILTIELPTPKNCVICPFSYAERIDEKGAWVYRCKADRKLKMTPDTACEHRHAKCPGKEQKEKAMSKTKELILKNQAIMMLAQLELLEKFKLGPEDQKVAEALSVQIDKTRAVLPKDEDKEEI